MIEQKLLRQRLIVCVRVCVTCALFWKYVFYFKTFLLLVI